MPVCNFCGDGFDVETAPGGLLFGPPETVKEAVPVWKAHVCQDCTQELVDKMKLKPVNKQQFIIDELCNLVAGFCRMTHGTLNDDFAAERDKLIRHFQDVVSGDDNKLEAIAFKNSLGPALQMPDDVIEGKVPSDGEATDDSLSAACRTAMDIADIRGGVWCVVLENASQCLHTFNLETVVRYKGQQPEAFYRIWTIIWQTDDPYVPIRFCPKCRVAWTEGGHVCVERAN